MSTHTPGPWKVVCNQFSRYEIHYSGGQLAGVAKWDDPASPPPIHEMHANAKLIAAAPDLLKSQTMGAELNTPDFLDWIADRLIHVHGEHPNMDYILSLRTRAVAGRYAITKATQP